MPSSEKRRREHVVSTHGSSDRKRKQARHEHSEPMSPSAFQIESDSALCDRCRAIDFSLFSKRYVKKSDDIVAWIGQVDYGLLESSCPFCSFLATLVYCSSTKNDPQDCQEYALRAFPGAVKLCHLISRVNIVHMQKLAETTVLGLVHVVKSNSQRPIVLSQQDILTQLGYISPTIIPEWEGIPHAVARKMNPNSIDFNLLKRWIERCTSRHRLTCKALEEETQILSLHVIDCVDAKVVKAPESCQYVALSYVWGSARSYMDVEKAQHFDSTGKLPTELPAVIQDVMSVVRSLNRRYLWVDRYCIDQSDEAAKREQLRLMALIYNHAYLTIVAAAGSDASFGLPGVGVRGRISQPTVNVGGRTLVCTMQDPQITVMNSTWMTRGWVCRDL